MNSFVLEKNFSFIRLKKKSTLTFYIYSFYIFLRIYPKLYIYNINKYISVVTRNKWF